jgi:DNA-binding NarL/FixJ family response regulator
MSKIKVLLMDEHTLFRQGIRSLLTAEPDIEVVGESSNAGEAVTLFLQMRPDVVLMGIGGTGMSSFEATRQIRKECPQAKVVFLSMYDDEDYLAEAVDVGASGYILKDSPFDFLLSGICEVVAGGSCLSPRLLTRLVDNFRMQDQGPVRQPRFGTLTKREREVLKVLAEGRSLKEIASDFNRSVKTIEAQKYSMMHKLDLHTTAAVVQYAIRKKIIRLDGPVAPMAASPEERLPPIYSVNV